MGANENKRIIEDVFDQLARGNVRALSDAMADGCSWTFPGNWSWSGTWAPKTSVVNDLLRPLMAQFADGYHGTADEIFAAGDRVVVQARGRAVTRRGDAYDQTYCFIYRLVDGRITEIVEHCDTALVERVLDAPTAVPPPRTAADLTTR